MIGIGGPGKGLFRLRPSPSIPITDPKDLAKGTYLSGGTYHRSHVTRQSRGPDKGKYLSAGTYQRGHVTPPERPI